MNFIKEKLPVILGVIVFAILCGGILYYMENGESYYYTQIDNTKIKSIASSDEMKYEYTLTCYDKNGKAKEIKFKTSRELRETAYLKLKVLSVTGVNNWEEVQYDDLPSKVQEKYKN
jgi:uncharacterized protein (TIGR01655 family)